MEGAMIYPKLISHLFCIDWSDQDHIKNIACTKYFRNRKKLKKLS